MALGKSDPQIGRHLRGGRAEKVPGNGDKDRGANVVRTILDRLDASGRVHAVDIGCRLGLVDLPEGICPPEQGIPPHQLQPAVLLASGLPYKEIARRLDRSPLTVKSNLHRLYGRLGAESGAHAVYTLHALKELPTDHPCECSKP